MTANPVRVAQRAMREMRRRAELTPPRRDRHVDLIRAVAIGAVVIGHWLAVYVTHDDSGFHGGSVLETVPWTRPLTWVFQVMPLFFLVGGFANAASLTSFVGRGGDALGWVRDRTARLVPPTTALLGTLAAGALAARALGAAPAVIGAAIWLALIPLWFLVAYIAVVVVTPPMHALHRRAGLAVPIILAALVGAGDLARLALDMPEAGRANFLLAWLAVHQLGFAWQDGRLPTRWTVALPLAVAGVIALVLLTVLGPYPISMVAAGGNVPQNTSPPTLALLALAVAQTGLALWSHDRGNRWLRRLKPWTAVVAVNSVIMTLFLWHMTAVVFSILALYGTDVMPEPAPGSAGWLILRIPWIACLALILAVLVALFGRVERRTASPLDPAGHARGAVPAVLTIAGVCAVLTGLLGVALAGPGYHGLAGPPSGMLVIYAIGATLLRTLLSRDRRPAPG